MNFTNSPYERMMKEIPHKDIPAPQKAPEGTPCAGVLIGGRLLAFSVIRNALKSRTDVLTFGLKKGPVCKDFRQRFWWW